MRRTGPHKAYGLFAHLTWHTWRREPVICSQDVPIVVQAIQNAAERHHINVLAQAVLSDHVHVLVSYRPDYALAPFVRDAKSESSRRINEHAQSDLRWCRGYYAGSVSHSHIPAARVYLARQNRRHPDRIPSG